MWQDKNWLLQDVTDEKADLLAKELAIPLTIAKMLFRRGVTEVQEARFFLGLEEEPFHDPFLLPGMKTAVDHIEQAVKQAWPIVVYGDYDVDGASATTLLVRFLTRRGAQVTYYIPERQQEGYGLNIAALQRLAECGAKLVITVDCGISASEEVAAAKEVLDIIITDHHQPPEKLPDATAIVNPKLSSSTYPFAELSGVGVALKVCQGLAARFAVEEAEWRALVELAMLGTIADIVPLVGENRLIVRKGLASINNGGAVKGLQALLQVSGNGGKQVDAGVIGFGLAPRLNAAGRLARAESAVQLLLSEDEAQLVKMAGELDQENQDRQQIEKQILLKAEEMVRAQGGAHGVLVLASEGWHSGVIGIVASRLVERYYVPVVLISLSENVGKGSCRSIEAFDMYQGLQFCTQHLLQFGGHRQAAGLTIARDAIDAFRKAMEEAAALQLTEADYRQPLRLDDSITLGDVTNELMHWLVKLEPFGMGNPRPAFAFRQVTIRDVQSMGREKDHLRLQFSDQTGEQRAVMWRGACYLPALRPGLQIDIAAVAEYNYWRDKAYIQLRVLDIRQDVWVLDYRNETEKETYLKNILQIDKKTVVYDKNGFQNTDKHVRILPYYSPIPSDCELLVLAELPPCDEGRTKWLKTLPKMTCHLALLFNREDELQWLQEEEKHTLNREKLAVLYRFLKQQNASQEVIAAPFDDNLMQAGLAILTELGLGKQEDSGNFKLISYNGGAKKSIEQSSLFRRLRDESLLRKEQIANLFQRPADVWMHKLEDE